MICGTDDAQRLKQENGVEHTQEQKASTGGKNRRRALKAAAEAREVNQTLVDDENFRRIADVWSLTP